MSDDDVYGDEMDTPAEFDDQAAEALLSESGRSVDPQLADLFDDMRVAYISQPPAVGAELAAVLAEAELAREASPTRRFERMRSSLAAKAGAAAAAVFAATGGLAVAHALPASMQDAAAAVGIGTPAHHAHSADAVSVSPDDPTTTTVSESTTVPGNDAVEQGDDNDQGVVVGTNQGDDNDDQGENECEADDQGEPDETTSTTVPCVTTTTDPATEPTVPVSPEGDQGENNDENGNTTVTTVPEVHDGNNQGTTGSGDAGDDQQGSTPTTTSPSGGSGGSGSQSGPGNGDSQGG